MRKVEIRLALLALVLGSGLALANCGSCAAGKPECKEGCTKPCCAAKAGPACKAGCEKPCCEKGDAAKCADGAGAKCAMDAAPKCSAGGACAMSGAAAAAVAPSEEAAETAEIGTEALHLLLHSGVAVTVLDARAGKWDDGKRLPGAKALAAADAASKASGLIPSTEGLVVTYCSNLECKASAKLAAALRAQGYENVIEYPAGIAGWIAAGHPVEDAK